MFSFKNHKIKIFGILFISILIFFYFLAKRDNVKITQQKLTLGTIVSVDVCVASIRRDEAKGVLKKAWSRINEINNRMNVYNPKSDVRKINASYPKQIKVHADTYFLLNEARRFSIKTDGIFDITVWPLVSLWQKSGENGVMPSKLEVSEEKNKVGFWNIQLLDDNTVRILHPGTKIDLSAIAKGYAVDEAAKILRESGIKNFLINAGGDIFVSGKNCKNKVWMVGVQDPSQRKVIIGKVRITNAAITTSGDYEQSHVIAGEQYSHIIDPRTGYPAKAVSSATVVADSAMKADAFSTALCVLGAQQGLAWADQVDEDISVLLIEKDENGQVAKYSNKKYKNLTK